MKRSIIISMFLLVFTTSIFAKPINTKKGYLNLPWGSTVNDAKKQGYNLEPFSDELKEMFSSIFVTDVDIYQVETPDNFSGMLAFVYYKDNFFCAIEQIENDCTQKSLEKRYGNFEKEGIVDMGDYYCDLVTDETGSHIENMTILICPDEYDTVSTMIFDWSIFKNVSVIGKQLTGN